MLLRSVSAKWLLGSVSANCYFTDRPQLAITIKQSNLGTLRKNTIQKRIESAGRRFRYVAIPFYTNKTTGKL
jgi:hypothetical protein